MAMNVVLVAPSSGVGGSELVPHPFSMQYAEQRFHDGSHLAPPIRSIVANVDLTGHQLISNPNLEGDEARDVVRDVINADAWAEMTDERGDGDPGSSVPVSDEEIDKRLDEMRRKQRRDRTIAQRWLARWAAPLSWNELRKRRQVDLLRTGNAWFELVRDEHGRVARISHLSARDMFWTRQDSTVSPLIITVRSSGFALDTVTVRVRLRRAVQCVGSRKVYFKVFGDPRLISSVTGIAYESSAAFQQAEPGATAATEVVHFLEYDSHTDPYGCPLWWGVRRALEGSERADYVNLTYFDEKPPAGAILVSGGRLDRNSVAQVKALFEARGGGVENYNKLVVLQAEEQGTSRAVVGDTGRASVSFMPFGPGQRDEAQFMQADQRTGDRVGQMLGVSRFMRGDITDVNRATAQEARSEAESGTFSPRRDGFDAFVNLVLFPTVDVTLIQFQSRRPPSMSDAEKGDLVVRLLQSGGVSPRDVRSVISEILRIDLDRTDDPRAGYLIIPNRSTILPDEEPQV